jgi:hypothetical protein
LTSCRTRPGLGSLPRGHGATIPQDPRLRGRHLLPPVMALQLRHLWPRAECRVPVTTGLRSCASLRRSC